jgi:hypothetical protein
MEVLKVGTKNVVECRGCGSVLRYEDSDIKLGGKREINVGPYEVECMPEPEDYYTTYVGCPVCKKPVNMSAPRSLKVKLIEADRRADHDI